MVEDSGTTAGPGALRPLNQPFPVTVEATSRGIPKAVLWHGRVRQITAIHDSWRIDDEWWRDLISRRYFQVECEGGQQLTIYRDLAHELWYMQPYSGGKGLRRG